MANGTRRLVLLSGRGEAEAQLTEEALKASGITGGCSVSPPLFCPADPLTRGQMAVFLAKALGLHRPN